MGTSAQQGPIYVYGQRPPIGSGGSNNPDVGPSGFWAGVGIIDGRIGYNVTRAGGVMWYGAQPMTIDQIPSTISATALAAAQVPVAGTALTLGISTGITLLAAPLYVAGSGNIIPAGTFVINSNPGLVGLGSLASLSTGSDKNSAYDPTTMISRCLSITSVGVDTGATFLISGYDVYGYPMTQLVTGGSAAAVNTLKAFKFVASVLPAGTLSGSNVSVGVADIIGFPLYCPRFAYAEMTYNNVPISSATGFTAGDTTSPATNLTGDPRGTYALQSASDGTKRLQIIINPPVATCNSNSGLFGQTPA